MSQFLTVAFIGFFIVSFGNLNAPKANIFESSHQIEMKYDVLCTDCTIYSNLEIQKRNFLKPNESGLLVAPLSNAFSDYEYSVLGRLAHEIRSSSLGNEIFDRLFIKNQNLNYTPKFQFKIMMEYNIQNGKINDKKPLWEIEGAIPHEFFAFYNSSSKNAVIALHNYQPRALGSYSFIHEAFHLLDGYFINSTPIAVPKTEGIDISAEIKHFISEFRAHLAEVIFHKESQGQSKEHNEFINFFGSGVNYEKVYNYTLNVLYPLDEKQIHLFKVNDESGNTVSISPYEVLYNLTLGFLDKKNSDETSDVELQLLKYSQDRKQTQIIVEKNKYIRSLIEYYIKNNLGGLDKFFEIHSENSIRSLRSDGLFNSSIDGGGGRPRSGGN